MTIGMTAEEKLGCAPFGNMDADNSNKIVFSDFIITPPEGEESKVD